MNFHVNDGYPAGKQYWANDGRKYWTDIGKTCCTILAQHWAQYCSNVGNRYTTTILANRLLGKNCHDIGSYTLRLSANIAEKYRAGLDHIGNSTRQNISYIRFQIYLHFQNRSYIEA